MKFKKGDLVKVDLMEIIKTTSGIEGEKDLSEFFDKEDLDLIMNKNSIFCIETVDYFREPYYLLSFSDRIVSWFYENELIKIN